MGVGKLMLTNAAYTLVDKEIQLGPMDGRLQRGHATNVTYHCRLHFVSVAKSFFRNSQYLYILHTPYFLAKLFKTKFC